MRESVSVTNHGKKTYYISVDLDSRAGGRSGRQTLPPGETFVFMTEYVNRIEIGPSE